MSWKLCLSQRSLFCELPCLLFFLISPTQPLALSEPLWLRCQHWFALPECLDWPKLPSAGCECWLVLRVVLNHSFCNFCKILLSQRIAPLGTNCFEKSANFFFLCQLRNWSTGTPESLDNSSVVSSSILCCNTVYSLPFSVVSSNIAEIWKLNQRFF